MHCTHSAETLRLVAWLWVAASAFGIVASAGMWGTTHNSVWIAPLVISILCAVLCACYLDERSRGSWSCCCRTVDTKKEEVTIAVVEFEK